MDSISPDIAKKLLHRDLANLAQRVQRGGNLSRSERVMLQSMAVSTGQVPAVAADNSDLARILGVSRSSLNRWRKLKDAPKPDASGFHDVTQWREFMSRHELRGEPAVTDEETALRARKLLAEVEERELRLAVKKREYVSIEEVRQTWTRLVGRAKELLRNKFENELPPILSGLDATAIQEESRRAIDEVLGVLHSGG
jgi:DNA-binding transcriptional regulator YdaS (Cro superfamily)